MFANKEAAYFSQRKTLSRMITSGIAPSKLVNSLKKLQQWLPDDCSLRAGIVALENQLLVRRGDVLTDSGGQLPFSFDEPLNESDDRTLAGTTVSASADTLFDLAFQYEKDGNTDQAIVSYSQWLQDFGQDHEVLFNLGNIYFQKGNLELATDFYRRSVKEEPTYPPAWNNLGLSLHQHGNHSEAILAMRHASKLDPDNVSTMFNLADILDEVGCEPEAKTIWIQLSCHRKHGEYEIKEYADRRVREITSQRYQPVQ